MCLFGFSNSFSKKYCLEFYNEALSGRFLTWKRQCKMCIFWDWALRPRLLIKISLPKFAPSRVVFWQSNSILFKSSCWNSLIKRSPDSFKMKKISAIIHWGKNDSIANWKVRQCQKCDSFWFVSILEVSFNNYLLDFHYHRFIWQLCLFQIVKKKFQDSVLWFEALK